MPPSITSEKITLNYPLFSAAFIDGDRLLVGGGGGEGKSGVGNKITLLGASEPPRVGKPATEASIKVLSELELSKQEDAVMSLAVVPALSSSSSLEKKPHDHPKKRTETLPVSDLSAMVTCNTRELSTNEPEVTTWLALAGINSSESTQNSGKNDHFRLFNVTTEASGSASISHVSKHEFFSTAVDAESYQRLICTKGPVAVIGSGFGLVSKAASEIVVLGIPGLDLKRQIQLPGTAECADLDISDDGLLAYCTGKEIFITSTRGNETPRKLSFQSLQQIKGTLRSLRFCGPQCIIAVLNHPARTGSELLLIDTTSGGRLIARKNLHKNVKAVTAMDTAWLGPHQTIVSVAGADQSIEILTAENDKITAVNIFREVHPFQITKVAFSSAPIAHESIRLATTSIGNTVVVFTLPLISGDDGRHSLLRGSSVVKQTLLSVFLSLIGVVTFAVALQLMFEARAGLPLPMERNAILSRFNEVLGAKATQCAMEKDEETFMDLKEVGVGDNSVKVDATGTAAVGETVTIMIVD